VVRHFTPDQAKAVRAIDPLLFQALHPDTGSYLWFSIQECIPKSTGETSYKALVIISWLVHDETKDAIPPTSRERIQLMKARAEGFAEPLRSIVMDIPDDELDATPLRLSDYVPDVENRWDSLGGKVTLAGDAAHAMTMYRGEGANHGILDAALLVDSIKKIASGKASQAEAVDLYEREMCMRTKDAVLKSRRAALDAHVWEKVNDASPCIGARIPPATA
jgi:gentisate 1,2-dioxygenase